MKKSILVLTGVAVLVAGAYCASQLFAQAPGNAAAPQQPSGTRVAVINIGVVFNKYVRAIQIKAELEETLKPFKEKAKTLVQNMNGWQDELKKGIADPAKKEQYEQGIVTNKRTLEDLQMQVQRLITKRQEENLVTLWREVKYQVDKVAETYGFQIVLAYGDPVEKEVLEQFPNINRKMQAMDQGASMPLYVHGSIDITPVVVTLLNKAAQPGGK